MGVGEGRRERVTPVAKERVEWRAPCSLLIPRPLFPLSFHWGRGYGRGVAPPPEVAPSGLPYPPPMKGRSEAG